MVAIGGVQVGRVRDVLRAGAHGVAVSSGVWGSESPANAVRAYIEAIESATDE